MKNPKPHGSSTSLVLTTLALALAAALSACGGGEKAAEAKSAEKAASAPEGEHKEEGGLKLSAEEAQRAGIKLEKLTEQGFADTVTVTRNEILTGLNTTRFVLALVEVSPDSDTVRYLHQPFTGEEQTYFDVTSVNFNWSRLWERSTAPS